MKTFKKSFKFLCDECGEFAQSEAEYCDKCGTKTMRKATNDDYTKYEKGRMRDDKRGASKTRKEFEKAKKDKKAGVKAGKAAGKAAEKVKKAKEKAAEKVKKAKE
jgi:hypothetical protein